MLKDYHKKDIKNNHKYIDGSNATDEDSENYGKYDTITDRITNLLQLTNPLCLENCFSIVDNYQVHPDIINTWYHDVSKFSKNHYTRNLVYTNNIVDCYILCWMPNQETVLHDHPINGCLFIVIRGNLKETRILTNSETVDTQLVENQTYYIDDNIGIHGLVNNSNDKAISIHFYSPSGYYESNIDKSN